MSPFIIIQKSFAASRELRLGYFLDGVFIHPEPLLDGDTEKMREGCQVMDNCRGTALFFSIAKELALVLSDQGWRDVAEADGSDLIGPPVEFA